MCQLCDDDAKYGHEPESAQISEGKIMPKISDNEMTKSALGQLVKLWNKQRLDELGKISELSHYEGILCEQKAFCYMSSSEALDDALKICDDFVELQLLTNIIENKALCSLIDARMASTEEERIKLITRAECFKECARQLKLLVGDILDY